MRFNVPIFRAKTYSFQPALIFIWLYLFSCQYLFVSLEGVKAPAEADAMQMSIHVSQPQVRFRQNTQENGYCIVVREKKYSFSERVLLEWINYIWLNMLYRMRDYGLDMEIHYHVCLYFLYFIFFRKAVTNIYWSSIHISFYTLLSFFSVLEYDSGESTNKLMILM